MILKMFSRRWLLTTVLVVAAVLVMARLGKWQLDRLAQRRAFNARVEAQINQPPLALAGASLNEDLAAMEYREVTVRGEYDEAQQVALRNQAMNGQWGVHLITPLHIAGTGETVLVDRGWIPAEDYTGGDWAKYNEPGVVEVQGVIRRAQTRPDFGRRSDPTPVPGGPRLETWNFVNVDGISRQTPYPLLPVYIQEAPDPAFAQSLPARTQPELDLSEGPHMGYAIQWFGFALLLGGGYPFFIRKQEMLRSKTETSAQGNVAAARGQDARPAVLPGVKKTR